MATFRRPGRYRGECTRHPLGPVRGRYPPAMNGLSVAELDALIAEATVDCYDEDGQAVLLIGRTLPSRSAA